MGTGHRFAAMAADCATQNAFNIDDPGASGAIPNYLTGICHLVSAAAESRSLAVPDCAGLELHLVMKTDGGDITLTVASAYDEAGGTSVVFSDPGQYITLRSYEVASGTYAWRVHSHMGVTGPTTALAGLIVSGTLTAGSDTTDRKAIKGIYYSPANVAVAVPTIANDAAENVDSVAVDVSSAFSMAPAVGDAVIAIPMEALPTDCLLLGAYVTNTDEITVTFGSKEAGGGVTGASKNFRFLVIDVT